MIKVNEVSMYYPKSRDYKDYFLKPFAPREKICGLENVSLEIQKGDRVAFLGSNGTGKTTLLKLIAGLLYPTKGKIQVNKFDTISRNLEARKNVGYVLNEERSFYWRLTGRENLEFFGSMDNLRGKIFQKKISELIKLVELEEAESMLVSGYSSGMKQKLAIARGLLCDPKILILDEPTRALDPIACDKIRTLIYEKICSDKERTLLISTHNFDEVLTICNKVCVMKDHRIASYIDLNEILETGMSLSEYYKNIMNREKEFVC